MSAKDNWLANLRHIVDMMPAKTKREAYQMVAEASGLGVEYIYQLYEGKPRADGKPRYPGNTTIAALRKAFGEGKPENWIDLPPTDYSKPSPDSNKPPSQEQLSLEQTLERLGEFLIVIEPDKRETLAGLLKLMVADPSNKAYPTMIAQLFTQSKPSVETKAFAGKPQTEIANLEKPAFVKQ